ncbi:hypothetical protein B0T24DRAFT_97470 [Lasiosphaeria ovina]|uniref:Uncharacterized protein n=1 Tax=Lasiosphaeria ovina TaxID=92902 RepID=A0AAE0JUB2_9PEZI|nr:hypothetical protein B0T24DRAFT_97470 [Lasiosphaeria ovina]
MAQCQSAGRLERPRNTQQSPDQPPHAEAHAPPRAGMRPWGLDCDRSNSFHSGGVRQPSWQASLLIAIAGNSHIRQAIVTTVTLTGRPYYSSQHESSSICLLHLRDLAELRIRMPGLAVLGPFQPAQTAPASCALQGGPQFIRVLGCVQDPSMPSRNVLRPKGGQRRALGIFGTGYMFASFVQVLLLEDRVARQSSRPALAMPLR